MGAIGAATGAALPVLVGLLVALLVAWLALVVALLLASRGRGRAGVTEAVRLLPDLLRLLARLARDPTVPRGARVLLWLTLGYLALPIDLVPDAIPVIGYADDAILVAAVLRSVVRRAGFPAVERHWPGTADGLAALVRLTGLGPGRGTRTPGGPDTP